MISTGEGLNDFSQRRHEESPSCHCEKIDPCHHCGGNGNGEEFLRVGVNNHPKAAEKTDKKENETIQKETIDSHNSDQRNQT